MNRVGTWREDGPRRQVLREYGITAGELGATAGQTVMVVLLPVLLARYAPSAFMIGVVVGGEGLFTLLLPYVAGAMSDHLPAGAARRFGRRGFFLLLSAPLMAAALAAAPFLKGFWLLAAATFFFFAGLHAYLTPLSALVVDAVPDERRGSVQGMRGLLRAAGLGYGLVGAGLLFSLWVPLPFLVAAALVLATTAITWWSEPRSANEARPPHVGVRETWRALRRNRAALWFLAANALWAAAVDGIRPYLFLYARAVLKLTVADTAMVLLVLVAGLGVGSFVLGKVSDRHDRGRVLEVCVALMTAALAVGYFARSLPVAIAILTVASAGFAATIPLPWTLFAEMVGGRAAGQHAGLFSASISFGRVMAPMLIGAAIDQGRRWLPREEGYPFLWPVAALLAGASWVALRRALHHRARMRLHGADGGAGATR